MTRPKRNRRRGLAPLEFVLWLPVLLFVMALMVNYGTMATWRVRGEVISRHAAWRQRWPRSGNNEGIPDRPFWPEDAAMTTERDVGLGILDIPEINHPAVRGPIPNEFVVRQILNPTRGAYKGVSAVTREFPFLSRIGDYSSGDVDTPLIDHKWQVATMGVPYRFRRTLLIYELPRTDPSLPEAFATAVGNVLSIPHYAGLAVLDRDEDIRKYRGGYVDFHPRVGRMCELDPTVVREEEVVPLVDIRGGDDGIRLGQISRLPRRMTNFFLNMYRAAKQRMEQQIAALQAELGATPPPPPERQQQIRAQIAALQAEIAIITPKIEQLEAYLERLPQIEDQLRISAAAAIP